MTEQMNLTPSGDDATVFLPVGCSLAVDGLGVACILEPNFSSSNGKETVDSHLNDGT